MRVYRALVKAVAWLDFNGTRALERIPGFADAFEDLYSNWVVRENRKSHERGGEDVV